jgi:hypothetical protein
MRGRTAKPCRKRGILTWSLPTSRVRSDASMGKRKDRSARDTVLQGRNAKADQCGEPVLGAIGKMARFEH